MQIWPFICKRTPPSSLYPYWVDSHIDRLIVLLPKMQVVDKLEAKKLKQSSLIDCFSLTHKSTMNQGAESKVRWRDPFLFKPLFLHWGDLNLPKFKQGNGTNFNFEFKIMIS